MKASTALFDGIGAGDGIGGEGRMLIQSERLGEMSWRGMDDLIGR